MQRRTPNANLGSCAANAPSPPKQILGLVPSWVSMHQRSADPD
jgi:hypothetical protein